ncbi:amino-acid acetyltransferase domain protein [Neisseria musculi]|uniref:Amino-acid acetyltransferase domain protein n=1 Tax=Neisseria musculi TaxID=1815583 RepID=A0A7H1MCV2_9NEIS|nr:amino-acid acetyltransferase domain protein [Neisseria musculi]
MVHGSRTQIDTLLQANSLIPQYHNGRRITDETTLTHVKQACGMVRSNMEAALSFGWVPTLLRGKPVCIAGGNFVSARLFAQRQNLQSQHGRYR